MIDRLEDRHAPTGEELTRILAALANPHRLRIVATLAQGSVHVSQLAREIGLSRPLTHMHLQRLEAAGLVSGRLELSQDGKALKFFDVTPFAIHLTPSLVAEAARTLDTNPDTTVTQSQEETP
jgi:ArsR family transcriptional regulator